MSRAASPSAPVQGAEVWSEVNCGASLILRMVTDRDAGRRGCVGPSFSVHPTHVTSVAFAESGCCVPPILLRQTLVVVVFPEGDVTVTVTARKPWSVALLLKTE